MATRGIPAGDLRPFSVEDPFGKGIGGPTAADLQRERVRAGLSAAEAKRLERSDERKQRERQQNMAIPGASLVQGPRALESTAPPKYQREDRKPRRAPSEPVALPGAQPKAKKRKGFGCLTTILLIWGLIAGGQLLLAPIVREAKQFVIRELGTAQFAQVSSVTATDEEFNERRVYEVVLLLPRETGGATQLTFEQAFSSDVVSRLQEGSWVEIKTFDGDVETAVITRVGLDAPPAQTSAADSIPSPTGEAADTENELTFDEKGRADSPSSPSDSALGSPNDAPAPNDTASSPNPVDGVPLECLQARACCKELQPNNAGCEAFANPNIQGAICARSLETFKKAATAMGKNCNGL